MSSFNGPTSSKTTTAFSLWYGLLAGAFAWLAHLICAWVIAEFGCVSRFHEFRLGGLTAIAWSGLGVTLAMLLVAGSALWVARSNERLLQKLSQSASVTSKLFIDSRLFMAQSSVMANVTFIFIIGVQAIPFLIYLGKC